jgi:MoaA/NifB/PqqE/SkfB family radical SAM enzyme
VSVLRIEAPVALGTDFGSRLTAFCALPFTKVKVDPAGNVSMCCYQRSGSLGNLFERSIEHLWASEVAQDIRATTARGELHTSCEGWGGCPHIVGARTPRPISRAGRLPVALELDLPNTHCNIGGIAPTPDTACFMCPRSAPGFVPEPDRTLILADLLRPLMPTLKDLRVQGVAEPFWHGRLFAVLDNLGFPPYRHRCHVSAYTNGSLLSARVRERFYSLCPSSTLIFSLDAATPETYRRIRRLNLFELVTRNLQGAVRERRPGQAVAMASNLNLLNLHEASAMVELASELGVDWLEVNPTHDGATGRDDLRDVCVSSENWEEFRDAQRRMTERSRGLGVVLRFVRPLDLGLAEREEAL